MQETDNDLFDDDISGEDIQLHQGSEEAPENGTSQACSMENGKEKPGCSTSQQFALPQTPPSAPKHKKARTLQQADIVQKHLKEASEVLVDLRGRQQPRPREVASDDACTLYGQLLAAKLKKISTRNRINLQRKLDDLVYEAELNEVECSPVSSQISSSPNWTLSPISPDVVEDTVSTVSTFYVAASDLLKLSSSNDDDNNTI